MVAALDAPGRTMNVNDSGNGVPTVENTPQAPPPSPGDDDAGGTDDLSQRPGRQGAEQDHRHEQGDAADQARRHPAAFDDAGGRRAAHWAGRDGTAGQ